MPANESSTPQWHRALAASEVSDLGLHSAEPGGHKVVILRVDGELRAYRDACPHEGFPLSKHAERQDFVIVCNKHLWEFDAATGEHISRIPRERCNLKRCPVREVDGVLEVEVSGVMVDGASQCAADS